MIPDSISKDRRLKYFDMVLFGKIYSLSRQQGYCWATNSYLSKEFGASDSYVSKSIKRLRECGYITYELDNSVKNELRRRIYINYDYLDKINDVGINQEDSLSL
jgi:DNA-binding MarR family transcriptional regulator